MIYKRIIFALASKKGMLGLLVLCGLLTCGECNENNNNTAPLDLKKSYITLMIERNSCAAYSAPHSLLQNGMSNQNPFKLVVQVVNLQRQGNDNTFTCCLDAWSAGRIRNGTILNQVSHDLSTNFNANGNYDAASGVRTYLFDSRSFSLWNATQCVIAIPRNRKFKIIAKLLAPCEQCGYQSPLTTVFWQYESPTYDNANHYENISSSGSIPYNVTQTLILQGGIANPYFIPCAANGACE